MVGYIPPGNINLTVVQITITRGIRQALYFIFAFSTVEILFTFGVMRFVQWLSSEINLENTIDVVMVFMFGILGVLTWKSRKEMPKADYSKKDSIRYGMLLGIINPMQIPYWLFVGTYLISHEWIDIGYLSLSVFSIGSGVGAALALYGFARFAQYIQEKFALSSYIVNKSIALLFFALSAYHIGKITYIHWIK
ncbi:threonine/homoserine/homoserine lactone efflux protein [Pedobacter sp. AK017]|uniref:LysE family transporter n=1 Tax=Pedobacter sp. AK017 TaxID=2723073 RepID=UPI0017ECD15D|nr:LysE family transporter [Pedobacter sp. AK017]MBB5440005.1 threonine/homoserine/homoserine lactone efflux protein [Pedobacter sp. AK017]